MTTPLPSLNELPENYWLSVNQLNAIRLSGEEKVKYLQGQVTCDVSELTSDKLLHGAHCDAKGKALSIFRLITRDDDLLLIQPQASIELSLAELKKFGVFAKVDITTSDDLDFICLAGEQSQQYIQSKCATLPNEHTPVITYQSLTICYLAGTTARYLVTGHSKEISAFIADATMPEVASRIWQLMEINEGFPLLSPASVQKYVPQMLNVDKINGISFTKGCYLGQETVARMQYLGKNKKMMGLLIGQSSQLTEEHISIEKQLGENWRSAGDVLSYYLADNGTCYIQAVIANDLTTESSLRIKADEKSALTLSTIPYISE